MKRELFRFYSLLITLCIASGILAQNRIYYVSPDGTGDGTSWTNATTLTAALGSAKAGDQIWLKGFEQITDAATQLYTAPDEGFTVKSGVKLYGGFAGTETNVNQRETLGKAYQMKYRSVLSGDINGDDEVDPNNFIFPENTTRGDNAKHVLVLNAFRNSSDNSNDNSLSTVVDGLTIAGGHATDFGGGIYVKGDVNNSVPYSIDRCYLLNNFGLKGGAIYVEASVKATATLSTINQCVVYNNVAGTIIGKENEGGGIYLAGAGNIVNSSIFNNENGGVVLSKDANLVNSTVARNTGGGVDMAEASITDAHVFNSVVWGNSFVAATHWPIFSYSAYPDAPETNNNINLSTNNQGDQTSPRFDAPSLKTSFDTDYDWRRNAYPLWSWKLLEGSYLIDKGDNASYNGFASTINTDLSGATRIVGIIDINAYEFQAIPASRIRYVKTDGNDNADGLSWATAYKSVQKAINELAAQPGVPGEVWVAAGTYEPTELINGNGTPASFRMYDGISLYGGFAGTETTKSEREREESGMPWDFTNKTVLQGNTYNDTNTWNSTDNKWTLTSNSTHVVWFAPLPGAEDFQNTTVMEGFTIKGGQAKITEALNYEGDKGAGVYIKGGNAYLIHSVVKDNVAPSQGGGIYLKGARVQGCLVYNNSSETKGGGIYVDNAGLILRSMITNNAALEGGGVYLDNNSVQADGNYHPEYQILSTSVVSNNTSVNNGAVYCNKGGVVLQSTIVNNNTPTPTDNGSDNASQTGGLYIDTYAMVVNSVLWNNRINGLNIQLYAKNATSEKVQFHYSAVANMNGIIWNNTLQEELIGLSETNEVGEGTMAPGFSDGYSTDAGVNGGLLDVTYFWQPIPGANLRARGMSLGMLPADVLLAPELDITGQRFDQKPSVGAYAVEKTTITPEETDSYIRIYVDVECTDPEHGGDSWTTAYRSLNEAIDYMANLPADKVDNRELQIYVMQGDAWPRYASVNLDPKSATIDVPAMASGKKLTIKGGYSRDNQDTWAPLTYRTQINGNHEGKKIEDGLYHCITVEKGAVVEFDGFHIINGYAAGTANLKYGAGMLVRDGANVTVKNSIFENNTAAEGAAIDARGATLKLVNCVVNNNTNTDNTKQVINAQNLTMNHVTVVNNVGAAPVNIGTDDNSFAVGNTNGDSHTFTVDQANFINPTKKAGATLGYDTYLGGYTSFMPTNQCEVVNKGTASGLMKDITGDARSRGGAPDLGAYEAELPVDGTVVYVRQGGTGDGSTWEKATGSIQGAIDKATKEVWVAAGTYNERITLRDGIQLYGGFAKTGNPDNVLDGTNRDISNANTDFMTIIDGQNGGRVVTQSSNFNTLTTVEGFVIQNGSTRGDNADSNGAGVKLMSNGKLKNCLVQNNTHTNTFEHWRNDTYDLGGGGIYMSDGSIVDACIIKENSTTKENNDKFTCGAGIYMAGGTLINSIVAYNTATSKGGSDGWIDTRWGSNILGAAVYVKNKSTFINCTFAYNYADADGRSAAAGGVWDNSKKSEFSNCIVWGNYGYGTTTESTYQLSTSGASSGGGYNDNVINCYISATSAAHVGGEDGGVWSDKYQCKQYTTFASATNGEAFKNQCMQDSPFNNETFKLNNSGNGVYCINKGDNNAIESNNIYLDAAGATRIQYCTVDKGAYESTDAIQIVPDVNGVFYVTQNGAGTSNASSVGNASCAMELQRVLNAAGERAKSGLTAIVKIGGYEGEYGKIFVYNANTLSDTNDPQSYTFVVPYGVTVEGGYDGLKTGSWSDEDRNPKKYRTVLSAIAQEQGQTVNGYHTVTFGEPAEGQSGKTTIIDGLYLIDGKATSMAGEGNPNTRGGGAIVPAWAHVRNCVVAQCEAVQGGGLYLLPGATVSGTLVMANKATDGAGIYADAEGATKQLRAHLISCTITDNAASAEGGGFYLEDGAALTTNSVVWGNTASSDKNISGAAALTFEDEKFKQVVGEGAIAEFYPFNHCYVETYEMPSNYENSSMESDEKLYFAADRTLKAYSELIKHGTPNYENLKKVFDIAEKDMQGYARKQGADRIDVGAYAYDGGMIPLPKNSSDPVVKKIFVRKGSNITTEEPMDEVIGRSFYTSLSWLDDALDYITNVRDVSGLENTEFEIYLAEGTYKPSNRRTDAATTVIDQRQNSYVLPEGVKIYGGFSGEELYGYGITSLTPTEGESITLDKVTDDTNGSSALLNSRGYSDLNGNGIKEPWELEHQTILSGDINVSPTVKNAYHVVFSSVGTNQTLIGKGILLDGLTIKDGETWHIMSPTLNEDEVGRGGALYTSGVDYTLNGCRVMNSKGVRGGAIYSRDANLTIIGSVIAGNGTVEGATVSDGQDIRGGALYMSGYSKHISLKAINTLWANNETTGKGGAIATSNDRGFNGSVTLSLMNNTIVRNKAAEASAVYSTSNGTITNTVMWGGEGNGVISSGLTINNSASDAKLTGNNNVKLNASNMAIDGPRFAQPSATAGMAGNNVASKWNPASISLLTDAGDGVQLVSGTINGAYEDWWDTDLANYKGQYMTNSDDTNYPRYAGPKDENGAEADKTIDIGLYEYQYKSNFATMDKIYVDTQERGDGSGDGWGNATSDLRGAIIALSHPDGGDDDKAIYIRGGEYMQSQLYTGNKAYQAVLGNGNLALNSLTIKGSYAENGNQDFSQPTVFLPSTGKPVETMFYAQTNGKALTIEGITFQGAKTTGLDAENSGKLTLKNVAFRQNGTGAVVENTGNGKALFANTLFADGTTGLTTTGSQVTVVNATFANNTTAAINGTVNLYNSVAWKSGTDVTTDSDNGNVNLGTVANDDIQNGPNFVDPENENIVARNYMIRPSIKLIDTANEEQYNTELGEGASTTDKDLGNNARKTGDGMDIGAYEYNAPLQQVVYVKTNVAQTDGTGSSWQNPIKDLQGAIDLAAIYANKNSTENGYVFVHRDVQDGLNVRVNMPRVKVYGGMNDEVGTDAQAVLNARGSVLASQMSTINGLTVAGANSVVDGFKVTGTVSVTNGMLATSVIENATVGTDGVIYNSYVSGTLTGEGKVVNVTSPGDVNATTKINVVESAQENGYVTDEIWKYQLKEDNSAIDNATNSNIDTYIALAGHSEDLSGAQRVRGTVDAGCFETWNIAANTHLNADDMPTDKHVVYVRKGVELDITSGLFPEGTNFNVGFLLLEHGAGLRGNGNAINLKNFAVERNLDNKNYYWDLSYMPFDIVKTEGENGVTVQTYDGAARAAYDYQFSSNKGAAWKDAAIQGNMGMLMQSTADAKVRMYGNSYTETAGQPGEIQLMKYNFNEPWSSTASSNRFTHLENMSWNMFGSPFLCAMNYADMEYGRVIYKKAGDTFASTNTADATSGHIEAGSAVMTQTATLSEEEVFSVAQRTEEISEGNTQTGNLAIGIAQETAETGDELALTAVPTEEASSEFNMASDGVKMMSMGDAPQIYMERNGMRYSLLSAVDISGRTAIGVHVKAAGMYHIYIPDYCDAYDYETVVLEDKLTGTLTDLKEGSYTFNAPQAGDLNDRFQLYFNRSVDEAESNIRVVSTTAGQARVLGIQPGDVIRVYNTQGMLVEQRKADTTEATFSLPRGIHLFKVTTADDEVVKKAAVR